MRLKEDLIIPKTYKNLSIDLDDEYQDLDFYKMRQSNYNYIKRKYDDIYRKSGKYVGLYKNESEKLGYFFVSKSILFKKTHIYPAYTRYLELLEFGFLSNELEEVEFLIDYLYYYCRACGGTYLKIKTKEKEFAPFYELIKKYNYTEDDKYLYIDLEPIDYEFARHLVHYEDDKLTIRDLYFLQVMGFDIFRDKCVANLYKDRYIIVDRKTKRISYPDNIINRPTKYDKLNKNSYSLMFYLIREAYYHHDKVLDMGFKIEGYDYELIQVGYKLVSFVDIKNIDYCTTRSDFYDFATKAYKEHDISSLDIFVNVRFKFKKFYAGYSLNSVFLSKYAGEQIEKPKSLLERIGFFKIND